MWLSLNNRNRGLNFEDLQHCHCIRFNFQGYNKIHKTAKFNALKKFPLHSIYPSIKSISQILQIVVKVYWQQILQYTMQKRTANFDFNTTPKF